MSVIFFYVSTEITFLPRDIRTIGTRKRRLPCVALYVGEEGGFASTSDRAVRTMEWLLTSMSAKMAFETGNIICGIFTGRTVKSLVCSCNVVHFSQDLSSHSMLIISNSHHLLRMTILLKETIIILLTQL